MKLIIDNALYNSSQAKQFNVSLSNLSFRKFEWVSLNFKSFQAV